jgi:hypothetical protein
VHFLIEVVLWGRHAAYDVLLGIARETADGG